MTAAEFEKDMMCYMELFAREDVIVTFRGREVTPLTSAEKKGSRRWKNFSGARSTPGGEKIEGLKYERISKM